MMTVSHMGLCTKQGPANQPWSWARPAAQPPVRSPGPSLVDVSKTQGVHAFLDGLIKEARADQGLGDPA